VLLDRELRYTRVYQSLIFLPVVLSLAIVGFIWQLMYSTDQGLINAVLAKFGAAPIDWLGNPQLNLWAVLIAASWRHVGYMMILYLAGLKSVDPALKEAAAIDGARRLAGVPVRRVPCPAPDQHRRPGHHRYRVAARVRPRVRHQRRPQRPRAAVRAGDAEHHRRGQPDRLRLAIASIMLVISTVFIVIYTLNIFREERR
jgi:multiple sugar transport system permease protein